MAISIQDIHGDLKAPAEAADISMANDGTSGKAVGLCLESFGGYNV